LRSGRSKAASVAGPWLTSRASFHRATLIERRLAVLFTAPPSSWGGSRFCHHTAFIVGGSRFFHRTTFIVGGSRFFHRTTLIVMAGLGPAIHALFFLRAKQVVDARPKAGHDEV
jgi:hypothetical protein